MRGGEERRGGAQEINQNRVARQMSKIPGLVTTRPATRRTRDKRTTTRTRHDQAPDRNMWTRPRPILELPGPRRPLQSPPPTPACKRNGARDFVKEGASSSATDGSAYSNSRQCVHAGRRLGEALPLAGTHLHQLLEIQPSFTMHERSRALCIALSKTRGLNLCMSHVGSQSLCGLYPRHHTMPRVTVMKPNE